MEEAIEEDGIRDKLRGLEAKYAGIQKTRQPNADVGCWWALYDYGLDAIKKWPAEHKHVYPGLPLSLGQSVALSSYPCATQLLLWVNLKAMNWSWLK